MNNTLVSLIPALAGLLTAIGAWLKARTEARALLAQLTQAQAEAQRLARKDDLDELRVILDEIQEDRAGLLAQVGELRAALDERDRQLQGLKDELVNREAEIREERHARLMLQERVTTLQQQNERLTQLVGALREQVGEGRPVHPSAVALMRRVPLMVTEIVSLAGDTAGLSPVFFDRLQSLETLVTAIPDLLTMGRPGDWVEMTETPRSSPPHPSP